HEVNEQEADKVDQQLLKVGGRSCLRVVVAIDEVVNDTGQKHEVDEGRDQRQQHLKNKDIGQGEQPHGLVADKGGAMLPDGLECSKRPAEALPHQSLGVDGGFGKGQRTIFIDHFEA